MNDSPNYRDAYPRVVSLLPSATETVFALGMGEYLVGRSHECDFPPEISTLPACTEAKLRLDRSSADITKDIEAIVSEGLSIYRVLGECLARLQPDLIITQTQCEVCAVSFADVEAAAREWLGGEVRILALDPKSLAEIWSEFEAIARALGVESQGRSLAESCQARMHEISTVAASSDTRPTVATIEWIDPPMAGGNWMPELVELASGVNLFGEAGKHSPWLDWDSLLGADPDVIAVVPCGFDLKRTRREIPALQARHGWRDLRAVREGQIYLMDGNAYFNRPGPRIVESLEILAEILHPEVFAPRHRGISYEPLVDNSITLK
jgi:iron complex transport system substrate-binding protein